MSSFPAKTKITLLSEMEKKDLCTVGYLNITLHFACFAVLVIKIIVFLK